MQLFSRISSLLITNPQLFATDDVTANALLVKVNRTYLGDCERFPNLRFRCPHVSDEYDSKRQVWTENVLKTDENVANSNENGYVWTGPQRI